ncbi:P-loop containing nucleoside triphosphate hydrolase protein [Schizophyllum amplum]|uniref:P-loop containing nucleoside triphosphate hydrolase protein n=1 Tax=Schizophyllum amplum TaxID=97359 RepID=A0A550CFX3_9AGAR|nr:P-loop containing nucleoside triphosphate hydrolase protein [Auriculariopsis ampla]
MNGVSDEYPELQYRRRSTPTFDVVSELLDDLPTIYCVLYAAYNPAKFSVTSIAILQQISQNFRWTVLGLFQGLDSFGKNVYQIKQYYEAQEVPDKGNAPTDGYASYPLPTSSAKGMGFELENVTFAYPGSTEQEALRNITISIHPGQLVVIVGANGSGKSTLIKLLARLYDPTSGTLTVDGEPISVYHKHTLRQATAVLSQDHCLFPMSVGENIGLGCPERVHDVDAVRAAAKAGGASTCIAKLKHRLDTVLDPGNQARGSNLSGEEGEPLRAQLEALDKKVDISGGETQRIVAARTFMRFSSGKVRAVLVDEPSSALDPEGELVLFDNLRNEREGKTMVFVTHRFGHLTKHADLIICMKEGSIAEYGLHQELMARDGEYRKLYEIQANAFSTDTQ